MAEKMQRNDLSFPQAIRSFVGYLVGTKKSAHTIKNYQLDIFSFQSFIRNEYSGKIIKLNQIDRSDVDRYHHYLKEKGLKVNTRRRKLLTVTQFFNYLAKRKRLSSEMARKWVAPHKVEKIPLTVPFLPLLESIQDLPQDTLLHARNRALLWTLAETGCLVSEVTQLRFEQWEISGDRSILCIEGKFKRKVPVSSELFHCIENLRLRMPEEKWLFLGFNRFGSLGVPMSARGVELLVKSYGQKLGFTELTPRVFRHSVILTWFSLGISQIEIQSRLGLKTTYAFRSYAPFIKSSEETTSNPEMCEPEF